MLSAIMLKYAKQVERSSKIAGTVYICKTLKLT